MGEKSQLRAPKNVNKNVTVQEECIGMLRTTCALKNVQLLINVLTLFVPMSFVGTEVLLLEKMDVVLTYPFVQKSQCTLTTGLMKLVTLKEVNSMAVSSRILEARSELLVAKVMKRR